MSVKVERRMTTTFIEACPECGYEIDARTEKRLKYLMESHRFWIHERGLAQ
jgi:hypothetical protein